MKKKFSLVTFMVLVFFSTVYPQWTYEGAWPDTNYKGGTHGIAVDPDGKVWTASYYPSNWVSPSGDTLSLRPLYVFNPDGSLLEIIGIVTGAGGTDTLARGTANCRGIRADQDGNILYVSAGPSKMIKINYQTRQRMASVLIPETGSSPTAPGVSDDGTIYVGPVVGGGTTAIATYGTDLNYLGNAVTGPANIARTMTVSPDGLSIYWTMFTGAMGIDIYTRPDELGSFALSDSALRGMSIETVDWNPATGNLWVSNDSRGTGGYSHLTWYEYDIATKTLVDSFTLPSPDPVPVDEFPRGLAFSPDGNTAYVGLFGTKYDRLYKFTKAPDLYTEDFESGTANTGWYSYDTGEDITVAKPITDAPQPLATGGNYVGWLQDLDGSFTGSAVSINGSPTLVNYSIEADVYCYVGVAPSAYTGLVVYADTSKKDFYKLRADFDASDRINFSGRKSDPNTFLPLYNKDFKGVDNPGLFPTTSGWHKMKIEVRASGANETSFWCYFDGTLLVGCPISDTTSTRNTSGNFGFYAFQQSATGIPGYFDNIVVKQLQPITSVEDYTNPNIPIELNLSQNYPNPFNPETKISYRLPENGFISLTIHDLLGRKIKTLVSDYQQAGQYSVTWNGKDETGNSLASGIYLYTLKTGNILQSKKMILMK